MKKVGNLTNIETSARTGLLICLKNGFGTFGIDEKITFRVGIEGKYLWMKDMKK